MLKVEAIKKAYLLETGLIQVLDRDLFTLAERPTAGPDAGLKSVLLRFGRYRVRIPITMKTNETQFTLKRSGKAYCIMQGESQFLSQVSVEHPPLHTPKQAFINIASPCIFNCAFCATPELKIEYVLKPERVLKLIKSAMKKEEVEAIALTSGVIGSERKTIELIKDTVKFIRKDLGDQIPIGVEPFATETRSIDELYGVGTDEVKVNVESFDRAIMKAVCPDIDQGKVLAVLEYAGKVFGKNKVCSNVLIGLGESDSTILNGLEWMSERGVVANLRPLLINPYRQQDLFEKTQRKAARPNADRIISLALKYRSILEKYRLQTTLFHTMCHKCTGCEIVPQQDV